MRAKKIATNRSLNESDVTLRQRKATTHKAIPLVRVLQIMAALVIAAALYSFIR